MPLLSFISPSQSVYSSGAKWHLPHSGNYKQSISLLFVLRLLHRFHRTLPHTFTTLNAKSVVDNRKSVGIL